MTGCGATSLAIEQEGNTILAVPFVGLIENKKMKYKSSLLGIYGPGDKLGEVASYLLKHPTYKIAVTYDSLPKLVATLKELGRDPYKEAFLAVDEWHVLCQQYSFRYNAVRGLLDEASEFERKTYISATPIEKKYWLEELKGLEEIELVWPNSKTPDVFSLEIDHPLAYMAERCKERLTSGKTMNFHVFINSVDDISSIINGAGLTPENTKVVCSVSEGNKEKNYAKLPAGFRIGKAGDDPKLFNFYTSTCFEGQDIMDENGMTFIVSDALKQQTMIDISTSFVQICGRIRNSRYKDRIVQIYSTSRYRKDISSEEYERETMEKLDKVTRHIEWMNSCPEDLSEAFLKQIPYMNEPYVQIKEGKVILDRNMAYQDIVNFKIVNKYYATRVNMANCLRNSNMNVTASVSIRHDDMEQPLNKRATFEEVFEEYCRIRNENGMFTFGKEEDERITWIRIYKPLVIEAYDKLGPERVREMKYHQSNIKREMAAKGSLKEDYKIVKMLTLPMQEAIPVKKVKAELQKVYDTIGRHATATATDIDKWFETKKVSKRINGQLVRCVILVNRKLMRVFDE